MSILTGPTRLSESEKNRIEAELEQFRSTVDQCVDRIIENVRDELVGNQLSALAFSPNDVFYKEGRPPNVKPLYLTDQLYRCSSNTGPPKELLELAIVVHEYSDMVDDIIDGEVKRGSELEAFLTSQMLVPLLIKYSNSVAGEIPQILTEDFIRLLRSQIDEQMKENEPSNFKNILEKQSGLFAMLTEFCAVASGDDARRCTYRRIGEEYYKYRVAITDVYQYYETGSEDEWNIIDAIGPEATPRYIEERQTALHDHAAELPSPQNRNLTALTSLDVGAWADQNITQQFN